MTTTRKHIEDAVTYIALTLASLVAVFPIYWMVSSSLKLDILAWSMPPVWIFQPTLQNYVKALFEKGFDKWTANSIIIASGSTVLSVFLGALAAYSLTRSNIKRADDIAFWMLSLRMMPPIVVILPIYILFSQLRLMDTHVGVILAHSIINVPFSVWMLRGFFKEIPRDLDDAAMVDGASSLRILFNVLVPIAAPGIAVTAIFCALQSWNDFIFAFALTSTNSATVPVKTSGFLGDYMWEWTTFYAAGTISIFPMLLLALFFQSYLARGMTLGAIKE